MAGWDVEQVLAMAPDAASAKAAQGLARPQRWSEIGSSERALWGLCQGSGKKPYQTVVDRSGPAFRCSCPSRKFPCKHALALMLLAAVGQVPERAEAEWASSWLEDRASRAEKSAEKAERKPGEVADPLAAQQRVTRRADRVSAGMAELQSWLDDQVRRGLGGFEQRGYGELSRLAARMVDAQAPGVAGAVRRAAAVVGRGHGWPGELLEELSLIHLIVSAHARLGEIPPRLADTVQSRIGWTVETARVLAEGEKVEDDWLVLGRVIEPDDHLTVRRLWLRGSSTGRLALILNFAAGGRQLDPLPARPGELVPAVLSYYPGALPMRALLTQTAHRLPAPRPGGLNAKQALASYVESLAADPWNERWPLVLADVRPARNGDQWAFVDSAGDALEVLPGVDLWQLLAVSAGDPITVAGEWNRAGFKPMTCWHGDRPVVLS
ncbi:SWIM zinc finger family protein [Kribbella sp. CA-293567]|uniref:SWIM zinc finger family protein n=1 Tax=Kribbella sp. CA-293567 TaxID=3002436 RepID=UPI0022DD50A9|nr:SWIM zinc finger family protein [Kribbella sp. CA-293567]WBQ04795.1 SWIM zinc finger family protein [Kribbella sp. CA-293567]